MLACTVFSKGIGCISYLIYTFLSTLTSIKWKLISIILGNAPGPVWDIENLFLRGDLLTFPEGAPRTE
jgi:hypothetical protein